MELDMEKYTEEYYAKIDINEKSSIILENDTNLSLTEEESQILNLSLPKDYYQYKLKGTILHIGSADAGHYISLIRDNDLMGGESKWYEFNDTKVNEYNTLRIGEDCFGGIIEQYFLYLIAFYRKGGLLIADSKHEIFTRIKNAYALIYERKAQYDMEKISTLSNEIRASQNISEVRAKYENARISEKSEIFAVSQYITQHVLETAAKNKLRKAVLNIDFVQFISHMTLNYYTIKDPSFAYDLSTHKFFTKCVLTVLLRIKQGTNIPLFLILKSLKQGIYKDLEFGKWIMEIFTQPEILIEFLGTNPNSFARFFCCSLIISSCKKIIQEKVENSMNLVCNLLNNICKNLTIVLSNGNYQIFKSNTFLLAVLCRLMPEIRQYLIKIGFIGFSHELITSIKGPFYNNFEKLSFIYPRKDDQINLFFGFQQNLLPENTKNDPKKSAEILKIPQKAHKYLIDIFSQLFSECNIFTPKPENPNNLSPEELTYVIIMQEEQYWEKLFFCICTDISRVALIKIILHLFGNPEISKETSSRFLRFLCKGFVNSSIKEIINYAASLREFLLIKTQYEKEKWNLFASFFKEIMNEHLNKSYIPFNIMADLYIELAICSPTFYMIIQGEDNKFDFVRNWLEKYQYPKQGTIFWINNPTYKKIEIKTQIDEIDKEICKKYTGFRIRILKQIENNELIDNSVNLLYISRRNKSMLNSNFSISESINHEYDIRYFSK